tara:strand:- start:3398 stop:4459 length:1062 start_codon:yes stop_codon:yes gene_type:complete
VKLLRYLIFIAVIIFVLITILLRLPSIQDRLLTSAVNNIMGSQAELDDDALTALVCGSGSPLASPERAQACILINAGGNYYVVDVGDGSVSNLTNWRVDMSNIKATFLTHLHSDHISDLADLHLATWINQSREDKLDVYGPKGVSLVTQGFADAHQLDYQFRNEHHGDEVASLEVAGFNPRTIDLLNPVIINEGGLKITAFPVIHDPVKPSLGYRFDYKDRSIVISGDTKYSEDLVEYAKDADVLFHEAQANHILKIMEDVARDNGALLIEKTLQDIVAYHTTPEEAASLANLANVKHLVFYHLVPAPRNNLIEQVFFRGVNKIRKNWTMANDGTMIVLPLASDEVIISSINE